MKARIRKVLLTLTLVLMMSWGPSAFADDSGLLAEAGVEKKFGKQATAELEAEMRTRNDFRTIDRFKVGVGAEYKLTNWLKADAGYQFLVDNNREKITVDDDAILERWRPSYYSTRHRVFASLTAGIDVGRVEISLRERWQYTHRPEHITDRYDFASKAWEETVVDVSDKHVLRSRLGVGYNIPHCKFTPEVSVEMFTTASLQKTRFTLKGSYKLKKRHSLEAFYRYQSVNHTIDPDDVNTHYIGLGYKFKF